MMCYSVMTQAYSEKEIPSSPNRSRTYDLPITSSDALPLSYRRLVGAKAIKPGSWDKHALRMSPRSIERCLKSFKFRRRESKHHGETDKRCGHAHARGI